MSNKKPNMYKTKVVWEIKKVIWKRWSLGDKDAAILRYLELNTDIIELPPLSRDTIRKVRNELLDLDIGTIATLVREVPTIKEFVLRQRPEAKEMIERLVTPQVEEITVAAKSTKPDTDSTIKNRIIEQATAQSIVKHWQDMANIASLLAVSKYDDSEELLNPEDLQEQFDIAIEAAINQYGEMMFDCFMTHLKAELGGDPFHDLYKAADTMQILAHGGVFKGKCQICQDF